jgi:nitrile hydratase
MNGVHDLGGMDGFGPIEREENEPVFHAPWEGRMYALNMACGALGKWNLDRLRYKRELLSPQEYVTLSYYESWIVRLENMLVETGLLTREELDRRLAELKAAQPKAGDS